MSSKTRQAFYWSAVDVAARHGTTLLFTVILARMLTPEIYGVVAIFLFIIAVANIIVDAGFSTALIQSPTTEPDDVSTVFWINLSISIILMLVLWGLTPYLAALFRVAELEEPYDVMLAAIFFNALGTVHNALLVKRLEMRMLSRIGFLSTATAGTAAVLAAHLDAGVWSLVIQSLGTTVLNTSILWLLSDWRPTFKFKLHAANRMFGFGGYVFVSSFLEVVSSRSYTLLIGRMHGVYELGIYRHASEVSQLPAAFMEATVSRVILSIFSTYSNDAVEFRQRFRSYLRGTMYLHVPITIGMTVLSPQLVQIVFGSQWMPSVPYLQILCISSILWPLHSINLIALLANGHSKLYFHLEVAKKITILICLIVGSSHGLFGIALGQLVAGWIALVFNTYNSKRLFYYGLFEQLRSCLPILAVGLLMAASMLMLDELLQGFFPMHDLIHLSILACGGITIYLTTSWAFKLHAFEELHTIAEFGRLTQKLK